LEQDALDRQDGGLVLAEQRSQLGLQLGEAGRQRVGRLGREDPERDRATASRLRLEDRVAAA
jgi:hypothetical protein